MQLPANLLSLLLPIAPPPVSAKKPPKDAIPLSSVQRLTLRGGAAQTAHRRVPAIPQLRCISPKAICRLHEVDVMRCTNQGGGYGGTEDAQWSCTASLPPELRLGSTDVVCEGYSGPDDPYVLRGSCGVEYRLVLTERGEERFPELAGAGSGGSFRGGGGRKGKGGNSGWGDVDWATWIFGVVFFAVAAWIVYSAFYAATDNARRVAPPRRPRRGGGGSGAGGGWWPGGGGGGDGGDGWDDPPPPPYPGTKPSYSSSSSSRAAEGWRPGFRSGLASGAAAGYAASNWSRNGNNNTNNNSRLRNDYSGGGAWGSGSGGGWGVGRSGSSSSRSGSGSGSGPGSSSTSSARYESTGFGSTSRR
ncbi:hypothetical protein DL762_007085 [Monosporascus cannonballus]|uniref:Store-operated calcium entry-associated regulatory factor n=1 Tax=Monosporascus cannonballus TaxID=155416 RepID=A0ABY0H4L1_9PEZI|nr:hypothetical protein DL762_007085 [Monosporascus cannonballus]